jgi:pyruvate dehydrogenase E2 component (dihydrolipoamide acetyltransferase)
LKQHRVFLLPFRPDDTGNAVLVGYGIKGARCPRRARPQAITRLVSARASTAVRHRGLPRRPSRRADVSVPAASASAAIDASHPRKLAKGRGVVHSRVAPTGLAGEITREDVVRQGLARHPVPQHEDSRLGQLTAMKANSREGVRKEMIATAMVLRAHSRLRT